MYLLTLPYLTLTFVHKLSLLTKRESLFLLILHHMRSNAHF